MICGLHICWNCELSYNDLVVNAIAAILSGGRCSAMHTTSSRGSSEREAPAVIGIDGVLPINVWSKMRVGQLCQKVNKFRSARTLELKKSPSFELWCCQSQRWTVGRRRNFEQDGGHSNSYLQEYSSLRGWEQKSLRGCHAVVGLLLPLPSMIYYTGG